MRLLNTWNGAWRIWRSSASRRTSFCSILTPKGIGALIGCRRTWTSVTCITSSRGWRRIATCGGRWPTNGISCSKKRIQLRALWRNHFARRPISSSAFDSQRFQVLQPHAAVDHARLDSKRVRGGGARTGAVVSGSLRLGRRVRRDCFAIGGCQQTADVERLCDHLKLAIAHRPLGTRSVSAIALMVVLSGMNGAGRRDMLSPRIGA